MHLYRQSIILFGVVLPVVVATAVIGGGYWVKSQMVASFDNKQKTYTTSEQGRLAGLEIEAQVIRQRRHLDAITQQGRQDAHRRAPRNSPRQKNIGFGLTTPASRYRA